MPPRKRMKTWGRTRKGAHRVEVYNDGRAVFLYDESHAARIEETRALREPLSSQNADSNDALRRLAEQGVLVVYELPEDNALALEVVVGPPLGAAEMAKLPWLKPQEAVLRLPSGTLRIDSYNTLPARLYASDAEPEAEDDEPARVQVAPGEYLLTLHRVDTAAAQRKGNLVLDRPDEIVTLTPLDRAVRPASIAPLLGFEGSADLTWPGRYTVAGRVWNGLALFQGSSQLLLNLDREAGRALELRAGMGLRIEVPDLKLRIEALLTDDERTGGISPPRPASLRAMRAYGEASDGEKKAFPRDKAAGEWIRAADWYDAFAVKLPESARDKELLRFFRLGTGTAIPGERESEWLPAAVEILTRPNLPEDYLRRLGIA